MTATARAVAELEAEHDARLDGQRLALEQAQFEADRARRQFDACEPEHRLVARTLERALEATLEALERQRATLAALEHARPAPLTDQERGVLTRLARDLPKLWHAATTSDRDRKNLLRALVREVVVTVRGPEAQAAVEIFWEGSARTELVVRLNRRGPERHRTAEDTIELIRRLAAHHPDGQIAAILNKQARRTGTGLPFTEARVRGIRQRAGIPAAPPPEHDSETVTIQQAANELGVSAATIRRWLNDGLLPAEQTTAHAPWRIRLTDEVRRRFVPDVPDGFVALDQAARLLGCARQTVLHKVQRGELQAIQVTRGRRRGLAIEVPAARLDRLIND